MKGILLYANVLYSKNDEDDITKNSCQKYNLDIFYMFFKVFTVNDIEKIDWKQKQKEQSCQRGGKLLTTYRSVPSSGDKKKHNSEAAEGGRANGNTSTITLT